MKLALTVGEPVLVSRAGGYFPILHRFADGTLALTAFSAEDRVADPGERAAAFALLRAERVPSHHFMEARRAGRYPEAYGWQVRSKDGGFTWEDYGAPLAPSGCTLADGTSLFLGMLTGKEPGSAKGRTHEQALGVLWRTDDSGETWTGPDYVPVTGPATRASSRYDTYNYVGFTRSIVECGDGSLLACANTFFEGDRHFRVAVYRSRDRGMSWAYAATVACRSASEDEVERGFEGYDEPVLTVLADGMLACHMRTGSWLPLHQSFSRDDGATWSPPVPLGWPGVFPDCVRSALGPLLLSTGRPDVRLVASVDGRTWGWHTPVWHATRPGGVAKGREVVERTCGYTGIRETTPGNFLLVMSAPQDPSDATVNDPWNPVDRARFGIYAVPVMLDVS
jgi:hypothetical protein